MGSSSIEIGCDSLAGAKRELDCSVEFANRGLRVPSREMLVAPLNMISGATGFRSSPSQLAFQAIDKRHHSLLRMEINLNRRNRSRTQNRITP
jgi:hypothetical protein